MAGSAGYFTAEYVPQMLYAFNPDWKLMVLLREPISRANSELRMSKLTTKQRWIYLED